MLNVRNEKSLKIHEFENSNYLENNSKNLLAPDRGRGLR